MLLLISFFVHVQAQKKFIDRKIAQKNYDAYMLMQESKYEEALVILDEALSADPDAYFIYQNRAICKLSLRDTTGAITDFEMNIKLEPQNTDSKYALGNIYKKQLDSVRAVNYFVKAIHQAPDDFSQTKLLYMNNFVGHFHRIHKEFNLALPYYQKVKEYDPENPSVFINSAVCNFRLDSLDAFCNDLEQAFILGGAVNCIALKAYCTGCNHLLEERSGKTDTASLALDTRLRGIIPDTVLLRYAVNPMPRLAEGRKKVKIYYNEYWQMCLPENALYYREGYWDPRANFFQDGYTDCYIEGKTLATGELKGTQTDGNYQSFFPNGNLKAKGEFAHGMPVGTWNYYLENGHPDYDVEFFMGEFTIKLRDESNENYEVTNGSGKFKIILAKWKDHVIEIKGQYKDHKKNGKWLYIQNGEKLVSELYKNGDFKTGYVKSVMGQLDISSPYLDGTFLIPPYLQQVRKMYFVSQEAADFYPFISIAEF